MGLYESLQVEFPRIDTALLTVIISDHPVQEDGTLAPYEVETIREKLKILADQAQIDERRLELEDVDAVEASIYSSSNISATSPTTPELCDSTTNSGSDSSQHSFNSLLDFLREAFSYMSFQRLKDLVRDAIGEEMLEEEEMERVMEYILNMEHIRELQERGPDGLELSPPPSPIVDSWETVVRAKPKKTTTKLATPTKKVKGHTIIIGDVRQTQHAFRSPAKGVIRDTGVTPWEYILSLSTRLATLLPPAPESHFSSCFHSQAHATPADALRAALATLPSTSVSAKRQAKPNSHTNQSPRDADTKSLSAIMDLFQASPTFATLDVEQRRTTLEDARLALAATQNKPDEAFNIVSILQELEHSKFNAGIYHLPPPPLGAVRSSTALAARAKLPTGPPPLQPPPTSKRKATSSLSSPTSPTQSPTPSAPAWQFAPVRASRITHPLEDPSPACKRKVRGAGNGLGKGGKGDEGQLLHQGTGGGLVGSRQMHFTRGMLQARKEQGDWLRKAEQARRKWGGAAALHYIQKAREVTERVHGEALNEARKLIQTRRNAEADKRTVDLHGTSVYEAKVISREILESEGCSRESPLRLITGRGKHSAGGTSVLKPAVYSALVSDGWNVQMRDAELVVRGRAY